MKTRVSLLLLLSLTVTMLVYGQGERKTEAYQPRTLRELSNLYPPSIAKAINERTEAEKREMGIVVHSDLLPSRVKVVYDGALRPLEEHKKSLIMSWAYRREGVPEMDITPYQTEMLFTENGENYWLVVRQDALLKFQELQRGDTVELFLIKMGNIRLERTDEKMEPVMLVDKFVKP
jgi:hypothetical protein